MKLIGNLRKQVENEGTREGKRDAIKKAGMLLTDDELDKVAGGYECGTANVIFSDDEIQCPQCGDFYSSGNMTVEPTYTGSRIFHCPCGKDFTIYG